MLFYRTRCLLDVAPDAADCKIKNKKNRDRMGKKQKQEMLKKYVQIKINKNTKPP